MSFYKVCSKCNRELPSGEFWKATKSSDGLQGYCKDCSRKIHRKYQKEHPEKMRESAKEHWHKNREQMLNKDKIRADKRREFIDNLKTPCVKCGESRVYVIQFHHIDPKTKSFSVGDGTKYHKSKDDVVDEVKKCVCLCANCHAEFHHLYGYKVLDQIEGINDYLGGGVNGIL